MMKKVKIHVVDLRQWPNDDDDNDNDDTRAKMLPMRRTRNMRRM